MPTTAEIRARLEAITLEGWRWEHDAPGCVARLHENGLGAQTVCMAPNLTAKKRQEEDCEFIAHAPADLAFLLAENDRLEAEKFALMHCSCGSVWAELRGQANYPRMDILCDFCDRGLRRASLETPGAVEVK